MALKRWLVALVAAMSLSAISTEAFAYCSTLTRTAAGATQAEALARANSSGLVFTRQLDRRYGKRVKYDPARSNCTGGNPVRCTITQGYCVSENPVVADTCPGDSVRGKNGKCVKEAEPAPRANPCSGGRLYSLSRKTCYCPDNVPVWTGKACISAKPVTGPTNVEIIGRCRQLDQQCKQGQQGACRGLRQYCDRG